MPRETGKSDTPKPCLRFYEQFGINQPIEILTNHWMSCDQIIIFGLKFEPVHHFRHVSSGSDVLRLSGVCGPGFPSGAQENPALSGGKNHGFPVYVPFNPSVDLQSLAAHDPNLSRIVPLYRQKTDKNIDFPAARKSPCDIVGSWWFY